MDKARKSPIQIRFEILEYLYYTPGSQLRTHVWRKATDLSYDDFLKYLKILKEKDLVREAGGNIRITEKGRTTYVKLKDVLPTLL
jgi:predicted transcriptional regulator